MYRLAISPASSGSCLSNFLVVSRNPSTSKPESSTTTSSSTSTTTSSSSSSMAYRRQRRRRGVYLVFIILLALLGATTSHCKLIEYICRRLGKQNQCEVHRCAPGEIPQHKPHSRPEYNGCGTYELKINLATSDFSDCCNMHDLCYGSCGRPKVECDDVFLECMVNHCLAEHRAVASKAHRRCMREARLFYHAVYGFGCFAYKRAQKKHCECRPAGASPATYVDYLEEYDLRSSLRAMLDRATPVNKTYQPKWEDFL